MTGTPPKVFISYSHDTVEHQDRVLGFADRLRADGIDAEIDQYNPAPSEGWALWCERQITAADVVLMVCTETFYRRVSGDEERGEGLGVIWEARIIRQLLYDADNVSDKFVPVLFSDASPEQIPTPIKGGNWYVVDTAQGYEELYRRLTRQPLLVRPKLGAIRPLPPRRRQWTETQSEATASAPSSSAARWPANGTVATGDNPRVAIGGNMFSSAAVIGDHNVTNINTVSDNEVRRHNLQEFSKSDECKTIIRERHAELTKHRKKRNRHEIRMIIIYISLFLLPLLVILICFLLWPFFGAFLEYIPGVIAIFYLVVLPMLLLPPLCDYLVFWRRDLDVYPALILEKTYNPADKITPWAILFEKVDGSREKVVGPEGYFSTRLPGEIVVVEVEKGDVNFEKFLSEMNDCIPNNLNLRP